MFVIIALIRNPEERQQISNQPQLALKLAQVYHRYLELTLLRVFTEDERKTKRSPLYHLGGETYSEQVIKNGQENFELLLQCISEQSPNYLALSVEIASIIEALKYLPQTPATLCERAVTVAGKATVDPSKLISLAVTEIYNRHPAK